MLQEFKRLPEPLQKQTLIRLGLSVMFLALLVALLIASGGFYLWFPSAAAAVFFAVAAVLLFRRAALGEYVVVSGECDEIGQTAIRRRVKYFILHTEAGKVKVIPHGRLRKIRKGAAVKLYIFKKTPLYEDNGLQILYTYMALEIN